MAIPTNDHTFVVLAYKESPYLEACICSLLKQTVKGHIIICTSWPSVFLENISEKYKIPLMINPVKKDIARDWSFAYQACQTKYVTLAHQDDIYEQSYTRQCLEALSINDGLIAFTDYFEWDKQGIRGLSLTMAVKRLILLFFFLFKKPLSSIFLKKKMLSVGSPVCCPSVMYNKGRIGHISFHSDYAINMDWAMWLRLAIMKGAFVHVAERLVLHRIYSDSATSEGLKDRKRQNEDLRIFRQIWPQRFARLISTLYSLSYRSNRM